MAQYNEIKAKHPDAIVLFRMGDFFETFGADAIKASAILGITLTRRANGAAATVELAGFPHHAIDTYLPKLVRAGERVAICEQLEDPKTAKGVVSNCTALRVRKDPSVKSNNIISVIDVKTEVEINLDESKEDWYKITTKGGVTGFCMKDYITVK